MKKKHIAAVFALFIATQSVFAQNADFEIKGGVLVTYKGLAALTFALAPAAYAAPFGGGKRQEVRGSRSGQVCVPGQYGERFQQRTRKDWAREVKTIVREHYPEAEKVA
jgi:hypothetical protein